MQASHTLALLNANKKIIPTIYIEDYLTSTVHAYILCFKMVASNTDNHGRDIWLSNSEKEDILHIISKEEIRQSADGEPGGQYLLNLGQRPFLMNIRQHLSTTHLTYYAF